ncbi:hypothetical protein Dimus_023325 [Dionaea muscipula]
MATILSPSALLSATAAAAAVVPKPPQSPVPHMIKFQPTNIIPAAPTKLKPPQTNNLTAAAAAAAVIVSISSPPPYSIAAAAADSQISPYHVYYGTAASAANYGGYGGNSSKKDSAEYIYEVPDGWKERLVSKVEKGTNGTDSEFYNPKKRSEKEYLTFLAGFRQLAPKDVVLNNLALSDVGLQDLIASADKLTSEERKDDDNGGQVYYEYEIDGAAGRAHSLISVTCANNKLYAHFVNAPAPEWDKDQDMLRHLHQSFKTVNGSYN